MKKFSRRSTPPENALSRGRQGFVLGLMLSLITVVSAYAHTASTAFLQLSETHDQITAQLELPLRDLDDLLGLDENDDGQLTWGELKARQTELIAYVQSHFQWSAGSELLPFQFATILINDRSGEGYAALQFTTQAPEQAEPLNLRYQLLFDRDPLHRCLIRWTGNTESPGDESAILVLSPDRPSATVTRKPGPKSGFTSFLREGVHHIWTGYDHLLFLLTLLLPAVLLRTDLGWAPAPNFGRVLGEVLKVVTAFTVAHSLTLGLAVFEVVSLPSRFVESTIAASIIVAALTNLRPARARCVHPADLYVAPSPNRWPAPWALTFVFGLIHGFGFASVLGELDLPRSQLAVPLFGFNAGVELGQLGCVALFLPLAYWLRSTRFYRNGALPLGSIAIILLAAGWLVERSLGLAFMPI